MKRLSVMCLVALFVVSVPARARELTLVEEGHPAATIVLAESPTRAAQLAALELRHHVWLITGAELPMQQSGGEVEGVRISVGVTPAARAAGLTRDSFGAQEYAVRFDGNTIYLVGRDARDAGEVTYQPEKAQYGGLPGFWDRRGTLHAAYDFLEQFCGVRWLKPTRHGTVVPEAKTLTVEARDIRRKPAFPYRDAIGATGGNPARYDAYVNFWPANSMEFKEWDESAHSDLHEMHQHPHRYRRARGGEARLFLLRMRNGGRIQRCNHSLTGYYRRFWNDPETRRPELFAKGYEGKPPQLCYTSPALIKQVARDARDYYDGRKTGAELGIFWKPELPNWFPVEPMDNRAFCKGERCQKWLEGRSEGKFYSSGKHSEYFFHFVNEVAKELHTTHPDRGVITLAYASHAVPPERFQLDPKVAVQFCFTANRGSIGSDFYRREIELMKQWAGDGTGRPLYLWLYYTFPLEHARNANLHCWPGFFAHTIGEQMQLFEQLGYRGMFHCGFGQQVEAYVTFKLMDDPRRDVDRLLDEYFGGLYGVAARPMKELYLEIERSHLRKAPRYTGERMAELRTLLSEARDLAETKRAEHNLRLFELGVWSYMEEGLKQRQRRKRTPIPSLSVSRVPDAGGDLAKVAWKKATALGGPWYQNNSYQEAKHDLSGRIAHDGTHLYLQLVDRCDTAELESSAMVFPFDDWEIFVAAQRGQPYRQYACNPAGLVKALSHGEVNFRRNVEMQEVPMDVESDTSKPDRWRVRIAWPLEEILPGGIEPGGKFYMNVIRVWNLPNKTPDGAGIDVWAPFTKVHDLSRAPALTLENGSGTEK